MERTAESKDSQRGSKVLFVDRFIIKIVILDLFTLSIPYYTMLYFVQLLFNHVYIRQRNY